MAFFVPRIPRRPGPVEDPGGGGSPPGAGGVVIGWVPANPSQRVEILRAPDSAGSPDTGNEITLAIVAGTVTAYTDHSAGVNLTFYHYRVRHVFPGYSPGTATEYIKAHGVEFHLTAPPLRVFGEVFSGGGLAAGAVQTGAFGIYTIRGITGIGPDASGLATATLSVAHNRPSVNVNDAWFVTGGEGESGGSAYSGHGILSNSRLDISAEADAGSFTHIQAGYDDNATVVLDDSAGTGTLSNFYGFRFTQPQRNAGISVTNLYGMRIGTITRTWITNSYGLYIEDISGAATLNYAIYTNAGTVRFGGNVVLDAPVRLKGYTVATLPAGTQGDSAFVTDALAPTFLAALVGGGAVVTPAFYDGTNWVAF